MSRVFVSAAIEERLRKVMKNSNMNFKHCALLTKGKRVISEGYNTRLDDSDNNLECCGIHAEICCIRRYFERIREGKDRQLRY